MSTCKNFLVFCVFVSLSFFAVNAKNAELKNTKNVAVAMVTKYTKNQEKALDQNQHLWTREISNSYQKYRLDREKRQETVKWLIAFFPDNPEILHIAFCESSLRHRNEQGKLLQNSQGGPDFGALQINAIHKAEIRELGLNLNRNKDYFYFVRHLVQRDGLKPWRSSQHCWQENVSRVEKLKNI